MIKINIPGNFIPERTYTIDVLLGEFLGLYYQIGYHEKNEYEFVLENNSIVIIQDHFFSSIQDGLTYLHEKNIPAQVKFLKNPFLTESDIPVIYGSEEFHVENGKIVCGIDVIASSFFMLSRWEEYVNKTRDLHLRFPATESLAYKKNFIDRPVVNEYVELLWSMFKHLGIQQKRKPREFQLYLTHDVDHIEYWKKPTKVLRAIAKDLIRKLDVISALKHMHEYYQVKQNMKKDPYDTFDELMDLSESINVQSRFYFMSGGTTRYDNYYSIAEPKAKKIIDEIKKRGHIIGFHPSYNTYNNHEQWSKEKVLLENVLEDEIAEGRQHFLRFEVPKTWQIWNDHHMVMDTTLSYADREGFRCGTCYEYSVFNILTRKKLRLKENPLIVMEGSFYTYQKSSPEYMNNKIKQLIKIVERYKGNFVLLWHNSSFNIGEWKNYQHIYSQILKGD